MNLTIEPQESFILARIEDARLDALSAPDFKARMAGALTGATPKVVLDLSPVAFIDSAGLASILSLVKGLPEGGELRIAGARDAVKAVFRLTRLDKVLPLHDDLEAAAAAMEAR
jgi:anti-sigma B factor antagonist